MLRPANNITPEMQAEDNYHKCHDTNTKHLWNDGSGKTIPKKCHGQPTYYHKYKVHMKALKTAFEDGDFVLKYKKDIGFGVYTINALNSENNNDKKKVKSIWAKYQMCDKFHTDWSTVAQTIK
eukprot:15366774-Ditylum_brightwellii.AAC.2